MYYFVFGSPSLVKEAKNKRVATEKYVLPQSSKRIERSIMVSNINWVLLLLTYSLTKENHSKKICIVPPILRVSGSRKSSLENRVSTLFCLRGRSLLVEQVNKILEQETLWIFITYLIEYLGNQIKKNCDKKQRRSCSIKSTQ